MAKLIDKSPTPEFSRISDYVAHYAHAEPDAEALVSDTERIDYREFSERVDSFARALLAAGVVKGDRIAMLAPPSPEFAIVFFAATSIGAIWVGLNPKYTYGELQYVVADARPVLAITRERIEERNYLDDLKSLMAEQKCIHETILLDESAAPGGYAFTQLEAFIARGRETPAETLAQSRNKVETGDPALIVYTSGTTGTPKGALIPHRGLVKCARIQRCFWDASPLRIQNFLPINHIGCVGDITAYAVVSGGAIVFMEKFDARESLAMIAREKITLWGGIPTTLQMSLDLPDFSSFDMSDVQIIAWSGAAAPKPLIERLLKITPRLSNAYGMTETVGSITFVPPCDDVELLSETVGRPVPDYEVKIDNDTDGEAGEILVRGDFIMSGYWNNPEATAETIGREGWLHTGDIGRMRPDGYVELVGRKKEMFKSGGYNVYPREIEAVLESHPDISMAAVIGAPDALYGEVGHAYLISGKSPEPSETELRDYCREKLANYKIPKKFFVRAELPLLPVGKIDKQALKSRRAPNDG